MEGLLAMGEGARTPSGHGQGTFEQVTDPTEAHIGPCGEQATHLGVYPPFAHCAPSAKRDKAVEETTKWKFYPKKKLNVQFVRHKHIPASTH